MPSPRPRLVVAVFMFAFFTGGMAAAAPLGYFQTNLTSDIFGLATNFDTALKNPWGMSFSGSSFFWVSDQATNLVTVYDASGVAQPLVISAAGGPTGQVFAEGAGFVLANGSDATLLIATSDGTILGWNAAAGTTTLTEVITPDAEYTGVALAGQYLYVTDANNARIDVFDTSFQQVTVTGGFLDPTLPSGFTPYNIQNIGGLLYVEYTNGAGAGLIDVFDTDGNFLRRISDPRLDAPWGIALAPAGFGDLAGALLIGNSGDGLINAFDPITGAFIGSLSDALGTPIVNDGLWALGFRSGAGFDPNALYFTAGINQQVDGLFGMIRVGDGPNPPPPPVPEPASLVLLGTGLIGLAWRRSVKR